MRDALLFSSLLCLTLQVACGDKGADDSGSDGIISAADARAIDLGVEIEGYENWEQHVDWTGVVASADGTHGDYVSIWMNASASATIAAGAGEAMPEGAILVKEGYDSSDASAANGITVMLKEEGWGDDGWFWAKYSPDDLSSPELAGSESSCFGCHASGQDSVLFVAW